MEGKERGEVWKEGGKESGKGGRERGKVGQERGKGIKVPTWCSGVVHAYSVGGHELEHLVDVRDHLYG